MTVSYVIALSSFFIYSFTNSNNMTVYDWIIYELSGNNFKNL